MASVRAKGKRWKPGECFGNSAESEQSILCEERLFRMDVSTLLPMNPAMCGMHWNKRAEQKIQIVA